MKVFLILKGENPGIRSIWYSHAWRGSTWLETKYFPSLYIWSTIFLIFFWSCWLHMWFWWPNPWLSLRNNYLSPKNLVELPMIKVLGCSKFFTVSWYIKIIHSVGFTFFGSPIYWTLPNLPWESPCVCLWNTRDFFFSTVLLSDEEYRKEIMPGLLQS